MRTIQLQEPQILDDDLLEKIVQDLNIPEPEEPYQPTLHDWFDVEILGSEEYEQSVDLVFPQAEMMSTDDFLLQLGLELAAAGVDTAIDLSCSETADFESDTGNNG